MADDIAKRDDNNIPELLLEAQDPASLPTAKSAGELVKAYGDLSGRQIVYVGNNVTTESAVTGIGDGVKTVTTAGTDEALATTTACKKVIIQAQTDNTGIIAVGASGVDATVATGTGVALAAGEAIELEITDLADIYIDSTVNGEGVRYTYLT